MPSANLPGNPVLLVARSAAGWTTLQETAQILDQFGLAWQHWLDDREPELGRGSAVIVASADALLPARWSASTGLPTIRVPVADEFLDGLALLRDHENEQLPAGSADGVFATMAIGVAGAKNAALFVVAALATTDHHLREKLAAFRREQTDKVLAEPPPVLES